MILFYLIASLVTITFQQQCIIDQQYVNCNNDSNGNICQNNYCIQQKIINFLAQVVNVTVCANTTQQNAINNPLSNYTYYACATVSSDCNSGCCMNQTSNNANT